MNELINDGTFLCGTCEEVIKAYTTSGDTQFCPSCGSSQLEEYEEE